MRRITRITIDNYRAYIHPMEILLPQGEDLLVYGENGSGKSSLYKALRFFLESSVNPTKPFEVNHFSGRMDGSVTVTYAECDANRNIQAGTEQSYTVSTDAAQTNNGELFIKTSYRASGFLDYSLLLQVYLNNGKRPNLFDLLIQLLGNYMPVGVDTHTRNIRDFINGILADLHAAHHRTDHIHQQGLADYDKLKALFPPLINKLNAVLQPMMSRHFQDMGLEIELVGAKTILEDPWRIEDMKVSGEVFIEVKHHGNQLPNYNERLNEARLSAIATCLYLSSLKLIANTNDTRVLFLDDVFIGLDLGNRLPVLDIVKDEFKEYQRIITTYDKSWYLQAKEVLEDMGGWKCCEMYEVESSDAVGNPIVEPLIVEVEPLYGRACSFLYHKEHPDYPASANYLRKAYEELLQNKLYDKAIRDENFETIAGYRLTALIATARSFVTQLPDYLVPQTPTAILLTDLWSLLHPLLHPLSHYVPDVPTYKAELKKAAKIYPALDAELSRSDYDNHIKVVFEKSKKIEFVVKGTSHWEYHYVLRLNDNLYRYEDKDGGLSLSLCELRATKLYGRNSSGQACTKFVNPGDILGKTMVYKSLQDCYDKILHFLTTVDGKTDIVSQPLEEMFFFPNEKNVPLPLRDVLSHVV